MRTPPRDNFSAIGAKFGFVPVEVWKQFGEKPKWRVEKSGRVAAMDGTSTMMLIRPNVGIKIPHTSHSAFDTHWLLSLANVQDLLSRELAAVQAKGWKLKQSEETTADGQKQLVVSVEAKANVSDKDISRDKWFDSADMSAYIDSMQRPSGWKDSKLICIGQTATFWWRLSSGSSMGSRSNPRFSR